MFIYIATTKHAITHGVVKIGCTSNPHARLSTFLTGCAPELTPSADVYFSALYEIKPGYLLEECESKTHEKFKAGRLLRNCGPTEWFKFPGKDECQIIQTVEEFILSAAWFHCKRLLVDIPKRPLKYAPAQIKTHNDKPPAVSPDAPPFIHDEQQRLEQLGKLQKPAIEALTEFIKSDDPAGYFLAPCGSGKTYMTASAIRAAGVLRCIICCPGSQIQSQWEKALRDIFSAILVVGRSGTTSPKIIADMMQCDTYCIITTYKSSHLIAQTIRRDGGSPVIVLDEAHHMVGVTGATGATGAIGAGATRCLLSLAVTLGIKRLSLTYTPRYCASRECLTMDDPAVFGRLIYELKLREMISCGVLPDYRIWPLCADSDRLDSRPELLAKKADCILHAWNWTGKNGAVLHHLIIFAATHEDAGVLFKHITAGLDAATLVIRASAGKLAESIKKFEASPRAILIDCFRLSEGVDIPAANAVAITYPKQSRGQITQMVLRAGRWQTDKPTFHVLIPTVNEDDISGLSTVLETLAQGDEELADEISRRLHNSASAAGSRIAFTPGTAYGNPDEMTKSIAHVTAVGSSCFNTLASRSRKNN